ncbi:MAG: hypothetical protein M3Q07_05500 [Pseudobdellovibrionaceae bacterium]|nr:hypothetical protein [Pseudobdellovibrionaceae bacterium]
MSKRCHYLIDKDGNRYSLWDLKKENIKTIQDAINSFTAIYIEEEVAFAAGFIVGLVNASHFSSPGASINQGMQGRLKSDKE